MLLVENLFVWSLSSISWPVSSIVSPTISLLLSILFFVLKQFVLFEIEFDMNDLKNFQLLVLYLFVFLYCFKLIPPIPSVSK